jgi:hypothetical protein
MYATAFEVSTVVGAPVSPQRVGDGWDEIMSFGNWRIFPVVWSWDESSRGCIRRQVCSTPAR